MPFDYGIYTSLGHLGLTDNMLASFDCRRHVI